MSEVEKYYYAGYVDLGKKIGHRLKPLEGEKDILFTNKGVPHMIGQIVEVTMNDDNSFTRHTIHGEKANVDLDELRIQSNLEYSKYSTRRAEERAKRKDGTLDHMTLRELKQWCKGSWQRKEELLHYLKNALRL